VIAAYLLSGAVPAIRAVDIISFNIASPKNSNQNYMYPGDFAGASGARTNNWNNLLASADGSAANITLAAGAVNDSAGNILTDMSVIFHPGSSGGGVYNRTSGGTNDGKMFGDVSDTYNCSGFSQYGYIDITNIPYANYNIYCYFRPDNGNGSANTRGGFWVVTNTPTGTNRLYIQNQSNDVAQTQEPVPSNTGGNYVQSTTTSIPSGGAAWSSIQGGNYVVFSNLTNSWTRVWFGGLGNGGGGVDDLGRYVNGGSAAVRFKVSGFQIVQVPSGVATRLYLQSTNLTLHAGNPAGTQLTVLADLDTGATGVDKTTASGIVYSIDNTNVATVNGTGLLTPGTNGTASLIVTYQSVSLTNPVVVTGPTALSISVAKTNLLVGNGQGDTTTATLLATFSDATNVAVNAYNFVSFSGTGGVITANTNGTLTGIGVGVFSVTGTYDGLSVTTNNVGVVNAFSAPGSVPAFSVNLTDAGDPMSFHDLSGAPGARAAYWNNMVMAFGNVTNEIDNPVDFQGNALTGTIVQVLPNNPFNQALLTTGTRTTNESMMFNTFFDQGANNGTSPQSYIVVSNVPFATYDAYFYFYNDNSSNGTNRPGQVTVDGVTQYRINSTSYATTPDNNGNGYIQAVQPGSPPTSVIQVPYGNVIKFSSITDAVLNVTWGAVGQDVFIDAATVTRARLAGFQIVKSLINLTATNIYLQSAVPNQLPGNPATYALTVLADFSDGEMGGNITALPGVTYTSADPNIFTVDTNGVITPGTTPGTADLVVSYQSVTTTQAVTTLAPISIKPIAVPDTVYSDSVLGLINSQARLIATFTGYTNVDVTTFSGVSFSGDNDPIATVSTSGVITLTGTAGTVGIGAIYVGMSNFTADAFLVTTNGATFLKHRYSFRDPANSATVTDSVGGANGTVYPALGGHQPITLDGESANFPGDADYSTAPYIALPPHLISVLNDVTFDFWFTVRTNAAWARIFDLGSSTKGNDPHNSGNSSATLTALEFSPEPGGSTNPKFEAYLPAGVVSMSGTSALAVGVEHHVTLVYSPNQGIIKMYLDGALNTTASPLSGATLNTLQDNNVWLGVSEWNDPTLNGSIDELRIYEGAFSDADVAASDAAGPSVGLISTTPVNIVSSVSGNTLTLSWPADHLGWKLQVQTNSLNVGLGTNWITVPGSDAVTSTNFTINPADGSVFYRLTYP
jgi:hypothetical protein